MQKINSEVAVILPFAENYDAHFGGAIARWCHEVSKKSDTFSYKVFSATKDKGYTEGYETSLYGNYCFLLKVLERKYSNKKLFRDIIYQIKRFTCRDEFWLLSIFYRILKHDIVIVHNRPNIPFLLRKLGYKGKILLHMHNSHIVNLNNVNISRLNSSVDSIVYCSSFLRNEALSLSAGNSNDSFVVYNGCTTFDFYKKDLPKEKIVLFAGRLIPDKGVAELIAGFELSELSDYKLMIVGGANSGKDNSTNDYILHLQDLVSKSTKNEKIEFLGYLDHQELLSLMRKSDIFAMPSKWEEPFGMVALEAYLSNCKIVATPGGGVSEFLVKDANYCDCEPKTIAEALEIASKNTEYSPRNDMSCFKWEKISKSMEKVLKELVNC
ncbi:MAG: glycosyltransferase family 4 protein [Vibrionaceae bacterium]|nr:glycosyltransferase family 4 protein [Vibrionaceae bacterium]